MAEQLPTGAICRFGVSRFHATRPVQGLAYSPDGSQIATVGDPDAAIFWRVDSGERLRSIRRLGDAFGSGASSVCWSADGEYLATGMRDKIKIWQMPEGVIHHVLHASGPMAFSPAGAVFAYGHDRHIDLLDLRSRKVIRTLSAGEHGLYELGAVSYSADGSLLAATWWEGFAVWRTGDGLPVGHHYEKHADFRCIALAPCGKLAAVGKKGRLSLWDLEADRELATEIRGPGSHRPVEAAWSADGAQLAVRWWLNYKDQSIVQVYRLEEKGARASRLLSQPNARGFAFSPGGESLACACGSSLRLLSLASARPVHPPEGHAGAVIRLALDSQGRHLVSTGVEGDVFVWDLESRRGQRIHTGAHEPGASASISADGGLVAARSTFEGFGYMGDRCWEGATGKGELVEALRVWRREPVKPLHTFESFPVLHDPVFSADGARLLAHTEQGDVLVYDLQSGSLAGELKLGAEEDFSIGARPPYVLGSSPGGRFFARSARPIPQGTLSDPGARIEVWRLPAGGRASSIDLDKAMDLRCAFAGRAARIACAADDGPLRVFDLESGARLVEAQPGLSDISALAFSPDDARLAAAGTIREGSRPGLVVLDAGSGKIIQEARVMPGPVIALAFASGERLVSGHADGDILVWDLDRLATAAPQVGKPPRSAPEPPCDFEKLYAMMECSDVACARAILQPACFDCLAALGRARRESACEAGDLACLERSCGQRCRGCIAPGEHGFDPCEDWMVGKYLERMAAISFSWKGEKRDAGGDALPPGVDSRLGSARFLHAGGVGDAAFSPDGKRIATGAGDRRVRVWEAASGKLLLDLPGHRQGVDAVAFSADGRRLLSASYLGHSVRLWDAGTGELLWEQDKGETSVHDYEPVSAALTPDGRTVALNRDHEIVLYDVASGEERSRLAGCKGEEIHDAAFSHDGRRLAWGTGVPGRLRVWDAEAGEELWSKLFPGVSVNRVRFSPGDDRIGITTGLSQVKVLDAADGRILASAAHAADGSEVDLAFSPVGRLLATGGRGPELKVWGAQDLDLRRTIPAHGLPRGGQEPALPRRRASRRRLRDR
ncbi:MAG: PQQ-binding-like beta-propeller repeat protein [Deltaproteobacteria bacterium]|nr:PQQ-binding-like beta-propeller repeat protein [Deltaproteobacteria bacterium]